MEKPKEAVKKINEKRTFIFAGLTILILSVTIFRQAILNSLKLAAENVVRREKLAVLTKKATFLEDLDVNQLEKRVREVEQIFPSKKPSLEFLNSLKSLAREEDITLGGFSFKPGRLESEEETGAVKVRKEEPENKLQDFQLQIEVIGTLTNISRFVKDLERTAPLTKIENLDLSLENYASEASLLKVGLEVRSYYQTPPKTIPAVDSPIVHLSQQEEEMLNELATFKFYPLQISPGVTKGKEDLFAKPL